MAKNKWHITKKQALAAAGVILLLAAAAAVGVAIQWLQGGSSDTAARTPASEKLSPTINESQNLALSGKTEEANKKLQEALDKPNVASTEKYQLLVQQGVNYSNDKKPQQALEAFKQAEAIQQTSTVSHLIAEQYETLGDKTTAITYYKKTISQLDKKSPLYDADKKHYEEQITALGGKP
jgi:tetratricopeptide (TPR) repeat protein